MNDKRLTSGGRSLIILVVLSIIVTGVLSVYRFYFKKDYLLFIKEPCDPQKEACFVHECDLDDTRCSQLPDNKFYYKILYKLERNIPECSGDQCPEMECGQGEAGCSIYFCSDATLKEFDLSDSCSR